MKKQHLNKALGTIIISMLIALSITIAVIDKLGLASIDTLIKTIVHIYWITCVGGIIFSLGIKTTVIFCKMLDKDAVHTLIQLGALKCSEWMRRKNVATIYPYLQAFLFQTFKENNEHLSLPLGKEATSLTPFGLHYIYRDDCIFYRFQLILPEMLEIPCNIIRQLMQSYIIAELRNYGIAGLYNVYRDSPTATVAWDTVYIDRVFIDSENMVLTFDVLYVSSRKAVEYLQKAIQRDKDEQMPEPDVYDDELN